MVAPLTLDRKWHRIHELPITRDIRRRLNDPNIVTVWNKKARKFVVAVWRNKARGIVQELPMSFPHPCCVRPYDIETLAYIASPWHVKALKEAAKFWSLQETREAKGRRDELAIKRDWVAAMHRANAKRWGAGRADRLDRYYKLTFGI